MCSATMAFSQPIADLICERLAGGESLRAVCRDLRSPSITEVMRWLGDEANANFREQYARAFQLRADAKFEESLHARKGRYDATIVSDRKYLNCYAASEREWV